MDRRVPGLLWAFVLVVAALHLVSCGSSTTFSTSKKSPGNPLSGNNSVTSVPMVSSWWDPSGRGLRNVYGVVGAAYEGQPIYGEYAGAAVCMRKSIAILIASSGSLSLAQLPQGSPTAIATQAIQSPSIEFSPSCATSLVHKAGNSNATLMQSLFSTPRTSGLAVPAEAFAVAVADSGSILASTPRADGSVAIQFLPAGSATFQTITVLSKFGGMAFLPDSDIALLADAGTNAIVEASQLSKNISLVQVASSSEGVNQPIALAVSADGRSAAVINRASSTVLRIDLSGQSAAVKTTCSCTPSELVPLAGNFAFRLNEAGSGTVWAFNGDAPTPQVVFLPSDEVANARGGSL
jgi:DNA-binding beta-propeller fold protein YncE